MSHSSTDVVQDANAPANEWTALAEQWQSLGRDWTNWWARAAASVPASTGIAPQIGNSGLWLPALPLRIDPAEATALTERQATASSRRV